MILAPLLTALLASLVACAPEPDPCVAMCDSAAELYGTCLEGWGLGWDAAGYQDRDDFLDRCQTWAWEARLLERDAGERGAVDGLCETRQATLEQALGGTDTGGPECEAYTDVEWDRMPWEE